MLGLQGWATTSGLCFFNFNLFLYWLASTLPLSSIMAPGCFKDSRSPLSMNKLEPVPWGQGATCVLPSLLHSNCYYLFTFQNKGTTFLPSKACKGVLHWYVKVSRTPRKGRIHWLWEPLTSFPSLVEQLKEAIQQSCQLTDHEKEFCSSNLYVTFGIFQ